MENVIMLGDLSVLSSKPVVLLFFLTSQCAKHHQMPNLQF